MPRSRGMLAVPLWASVTGRGLAPPAAGSEPHREGMPIEMLLSLESDTDRDALQLPRRSQPGRIGKRNPTARSGTLPAVASAAGPALVSSANEPRAARTSRSSLPRIFVERRTRTPRSRHTTPLGARSTCERAGVALTNAAAPRRCAGGIRVRERGALAIARRVPVRRERPRTDRAVPTGQPLLPRFRRPC